jgi:hypothetical protein
VLALGCAGTAVVATLLLAAVAITGVVVLGRGAPAAPVSGKPVALDTDEGEAPTEGTDDETVPADEGVALQVDGPADSTRPPGSRVGTEGRVADPSNPHAEAPERTTVVPGAPGPESGATARKSGRKAVVTTLLGGSNVAGLPPDGSSVVRSLVPQIRSCYERGIARDDEDHFGESMILYLHIAGDGGLSGVESRIDTAPPGVGTCVLPIIRSVRFSAPPSGPVQGNLIISFKTER